MKIRLSFPLWFSCVAQVSHSLRVILLAFLVLSPASRVWAVALTPTVTTLTITSAGNPATTVATPSVVTLTASATASGSPVTTGVINFCYSTQAICAGAALVGTAQLTAAGSASISFRPAVGSHSYVAAFMGNAGDQASASAASVLTVTQGSGPLLPTSTTIALTGAAGSYTLAGTVIGDGLAAPTGPVNFVDLTNGNNILAAPALANPMQAPGFLTVPATTALQNATPLAAGDLNGDGLLDLIATLSDGTLVSQLSNGDGSFRSGSTIPGGASVAAVGDFNSDGKLDVAVSSGGAVSIFLGDGTGNFSAAPSSSPIAVSAQNIIVGDFNNDGILDLALADSASVYFYLGAGDGSFTAGYSTAIADSTGDTTNIVVGDFNADGIPDIAAGWVDYGEGTIAEYNVTFLFGDGTGNFTPSPQFLSTDLGVAGYFDLIGVLPAGTLVLAHDVNGDGKLDVSMLLSYVACCPSAEVTGDVDLLNNGDGTFSQVQNFYGFYMGGPLAAAVVDIKGNGSETDVVRWNVGTLSPLQMGTPPPPFISFDGSLVLSGTLGNGFVTGDFNGDGIPDLALGGPVATSLVGIQTTSSATAANVAATPVGTGVHQVEASFPGDAAHSASVSSTVSLSTLQAAPTLTLSAVSTVTAGTPVTITATLTSAAAPTGSIAFMSGSTSLGMGALTNGVATLTLNNLTPGSYSVTATYAGDTNNLSATATAIVITVTSPLTLTSAASTIYSGVSDAIQITVGAGGSTQVPSGTVTLSSGSYTSAATALSAGSVTITIPANTLPAGSDTLVATYSGDANFPAATATLIVTASSDPPPGFTLSTPPVSVAPGATTGNTVKVNVVPVTGFTGTVALTAKVTGSPANANDPPTVSFGSMSSVTITGFNPATATLTVSTTAPTTASNDSRAIHNHMRWFTSGGTALACMFLWGMRSSRRTMARWLSLLLLFSVALWSGMAGCGGGSKTPMTIPGTTIGQYTVTITGTSGAITSTEIMTVTVQ
jgi:trimeric autotransporter adhesin